MKQTVIQMFDDLVWAAERKRVPADESVRLGVDGLWYELDLTAQHAADLKVVLRPYLVAAEVAEDVYPDRPKRSKRPNNPVHLAFNRGLREWAKSMGREAEYHPDTGGYYYPKQLKEDYREWLAKQETADEQSPGA
jgi:nucleoid-associated protein Lsr2